LQVITQGGISVVLVTASNNTLFGARLESGSDVIVSSSNFDNQTSGSATDQTGRGLEIISAGNVFLSFVSVSNNQTFGANIQAGGDVFLDTITATNNGLNGVDVETDCKTVYLSAGDYSNNGGYGLNIVNSALSDSGTSIFGGNGLGDIFQNPGTCVFPPAATPGSNNGGSPNGPGPVVNPVPPQVNPQQNANSSNGQNNVPFSKLRLTRASAIKGTFNSAGAMTLNDFLARARLSNGHIHIGVFAGTYTYIYSSSGMQIIAFSPASNSLTLGGS